MADQVAARASASRIARLAARQHGVVSARQLYALGLSRDQVMGRARAGWLHRVHRGVYAVGHPKLTQHGRWMAAVVACGEGAVLSHHAAAALWRLRPLPGGSGHGMPIEVTIPTRAGRSRRTGIRIHRAPDLSASETARRDGVPVTSPARTILDLARVLPPRLIERAIDEGARLGLCGPGDLEAIASTRPGTGGVSGLLLCWPRTPPARR